MTPAEQLEFLRKMPMPSGSRGALIQAVANVASCAIFNFNFSRDHVLIIVPRDYVDVVCSEAKLAVPHGVSVTVESMTALQEKTVNGYIKLNGEPAMSNPKDNRFYREKNTAAASMPAFPCNVRTGEVEVNSDTRRNEFVTEPHTGLSIRDYFAIHGQFSYAALTVEMAAFLVGRREPDMHSEEDMAKEPQEDGRHAMMLDNVENLKFWAEATARYRYLMADMMVKARD